MPGFQIGERLSCPRLRTALHNVCNERCDEITANVGASMKFARSQRQACHPRPSYELLTTIPTSSAEGLLVVDSSGDAEAGRS